MQSPWKRARIQMEEDDYDDGDGSYGEEEDDEKAGFLSLLNKGMLGGVNFINFVDRVLIRNSESPTHMFGLCCGRRHSFHLNAWINNAINFEFSSCPCSFASEILVIVVDAPKLEVLRYKGYVASGCSFENCISVVRAVIDISDNGKRGMFCQDNAKMNTRDLVKIHMGATAVRS
ncbi:hypothetical protein Goarm_017522 [Gossypium armourianum]|uniref:Uncharacterized protein n=1 Tax=Gossypium armourianum TaxID=34283 RepID=A0A7J9JFK4_9ROSI|nr:hypothetical protein [Gossypium armourianum]